MFRGRVDKNFGGDWKIGEFSILENEKPTDFCGKQNTDISGNDEFLSYLRTRLGASMCDTVNSQFQDVESCRADEQGYYPHQGRYLRCRYV